MKITYLLSRLSKNLYIKNFNKIKIKVTNSIYLQDKVKNKLKLSIFSNLKIASKVSRGTLL